MFPKKKELTKTIERKRDHRSIIESQFFRVLASSQCTLMPTTSYTSGGVTVRAGQDFWPSVNSRHHHADCRIYVEWLPICPPGTTSQHFLPIHVVCNKSIEIEINRTIMLIPRNDDPRNVHFLFTEITRVLGDMAVPRHLQQTIVAKISNLFGFGYMDDRTMNNGYIHVLIIYDDGHAARPRRSIDLNIVPDDDDDEEHDSDHSSLDQILSALDNFVDHDDDRLTRPPGFDLNVEPDNDDFEIECPDPLDQMIFNEDTFYDINHQGNLPVLIETDDHHHHIEDIEAADHHDVIEDYFMIDDLLPMDFEGYGDMETDDNGNEEEIDRATLESMETYLVMTIPASKSTIEELEKVRLDSVGAARHAGLCAICMEDFEAGVEATRLPCLHFYHGDCVVQWLEINHKCPLCRYPMPHDETSISS